MRNLKSGYTLSSPSQISKVCIICHSATGTPERVNMLIWTTWLAGGVPMHHCPYLPVCLWESQTVPPEDVHYQSQGPKATLKRFLPTSERTVFSGQTRFAFKSTVQLNHMVTRWCSAPHGVSCDPWDGRWEYSPNAQPAMMQSESQKFKPDPVTFPRNQHSNFSPFLAPQA